MGMLRQYIELCYLRSSVFICGQIPFSEERPRMNTAMLLDF